MYPITYIIYCNARLWTRMSATVTVAAAVAAATATNINSVDICVKIDNCKLQRVYSCKYLGVIIDEQLNWREHTDDVYGKQIKFTGLFYKIRDLMSWKILKMLYV